MQARLRQQYEPPNEATFLAILNELLSLQLVMPLWRTSFITYPHCGVSSNSQSTDVYNTLVVPVSSNKNRPMTCLYEF